MISDARLAGGQAADGIGDLARTLDNLIRASQVRLDPSRPARDRWQ
jgi:hypothetical protein